MRASDGRNYGYLEVTVTVNDVNETPVITTTSKTEFTYRENGTATIYTFAAADPERGTITWSPGGVDGDDFTVTADSRGRGVLTFASPPDFENPTDADGDNVYEVTVEATDDDGHADSVAVTVTVTPQNEGPEIAGLQSLSFAENLEEGRILAAYTATDPEDPSAVISRWSLSGSDAGDFAVSEGGELSFRNVPDFERPADSGRDNVYNFSVRASDGRNYGYLEVTVTVNDVNEALAITTTSRTSFTYRENGTATIYTFSAADPERGTISWSTGGADGDDFTITADSRGRGVLTFASPPDFENPVDADGDNVYEVTVEATDDDGHADSVAVTVTVTAQNEGPEIAGLQSLSFAENQATDRILATYTATDPEDPGAVISRWSLSGRDAGDFAVSEGGELSFRNVPDFERPADSGRDNVYNVSVRASDGRNYGYLEVTVTVEDVNEALVITATSKTSFTYRENGTATIYTFAAADPEGAAISWSPGGADGDDFTITADSRGRGVLTFASPPDFENPTDADRDNVYEVTVEATDDDGHADSVAVTVTVTAQNEGPEIAGQQSLSFAENQATDRILATYTATDPEDPSALITRWSLSGSDAGDFVISEGGELSFRNVPDYEAPADSGRDNVYNFSVRASDGRNYGYLEVAVTVNDINETPDMTGRDRIAYQENGTDSLATYRATDPERGTISWNLSGADSGVLIISDAGVLAFNDPPDYEQPSDSDGDNVYKVTVEAADAEANTAFLEVTVTVTNQTDAPAILTVGVGDEEERRFEGTTPSPPSWTYATQQGSATVVLDWRSSQDPGTGPVTGYRLWWKKHGRDWTSEPQATVDAPVTTYTVADLAPGSYWGRVAAVNRVGVGSAWEFQFDVRNLLVLPGLDWFEARWPDTPSAAKFVVEYKPQSASDWESAPDVAAGRTSKTVTELDVGSKYSIRVSASDDSDAVLWQFSGSAALGSIVPPDLTLSGFHNDLLYDVAATPYPLEFDQSPIWRYRVQWRTADQTYSSDRQEDFGTRGGKSSRVVYGRFVADTTYTVRVLPLDINRRPLGAVESTACESCRPPSSGKRTSSRSMKATIPGCAKPGMKNCPSLSSPLGGPIRRWPNMRPNVSA